VKSLVKRLAHGLLGDYSAYVVLRRDATQGAAPLPPQAAHYRIGPVERGQIDACPDPLMKEQAGYAGEGALAYACWHEEQIVGLCFYWHGERYRPRGFWPLQAGEAKLVQIITAPAMRGRKVAGALIAASSADVMKHGFQRTFARVWHSNTPSLHAFAGAGWQRCALVVEVNPLRRGRPWRLQFN
jgi:GNAT superfamily N-acetyltransferase